jgi:hypothetical protein
MQVLGVFFFPSNLSAYTTFARDRYVLDGIDAAFPFPCFAENPKNVAEVSITDQQLKHNKWTRQFSLYIMFLWIVRCLSKGGFVRLSSLGKLKN